MFKGIPGIALVAGIGIGFATAALVTVCANQAPVKSLVSAESTLLPWKTQRRDAEFIVDFTLAERDIELEPPGRLGMMLASEDAEVRIREVRPASPAEKAGFIPGHRIHSIAGEPVGSMQDVRLALLDRMPGDQVWVEIEPGAKPKNGGTQGRALTLL